jgi:hypothetical protein
MPRYEDEVLGQVGIPQVAAQPGEHLLR